MGTPYITPSMLTSAPTGIAWSIIPFPKATTQAQVAEQTNICHRATSIVDGYTNQIFRSTIDDEQRTGPGDYRINVQSNTGNVRWMLSRWPITQILAIQVSGAAVFPRQWVQVASGMWEIENPIIGVYGSYTSAGSAGGGGQSIIIAPGYVGWGNGRNGFRLACSYINGWPHAGLMTSCLAGATSLVVDDVTGMAGATVKIYDGTSTETVTVASVTATTNVTLPNGGGTAPGGPGTLTLAAGTSFAHTGSNPAEVVVSAMPSDVLWATMLAATVQALESGIQAVTIQNLPGSTTVGGHGVEALEIQYQNLLQPYKRVI